MTKRNCIDTPDKKQGRRPFTTQQFIAKSKAKHGDKFSYEKTAYINSRASIVVTCKFHGDVAVKYNNHVASATGGCKECAYENNPRRLSTKEFIAKAKILHGDRYSYELVDYSSSLKTVLIKCKKCGCLFEQKPREHLAGNGCNAGCSNNKPLNSKEFIQKCSLIHEGKYNYDKVVYISANESVAIECPDHGLFYQRAHYHLRGMGCLACAQEKNSYSRKDYIDICNRNNNGLSELYLVRLRNKTECFYKIGITSEGVDKRLRRGKQMPYSYEVIATIEGDAGFVYDLEKRLHRLSKKHRYVPNIRFVGYTECFAKIPDKILKLIRELQDTKQLQLLA